VALAVDDALNFDALQHAEEALRTSEQSFRLIVDSIPGLVNTTTAEGEFEFVSQQCLDYFGTTLEELKIQESKGWTTSTLFIRMTFLACWPRGDARSKLGILTSLNTASGVPMAHTVVPCTLSPLAGHGGTYHPLVYPADGY